MLYWASTKMNKKDLHILLQVEQMEWVKLRVRLEKEMGVKAASHLEPHKWYYLVQWYQQEYQV
jgi:hypothetical protein